MQDLKKQEGFELEVLDKLNSKKLLNNLVFSGGTMLRLCYGLDRYSVDLDFWVIRDFDFRNLYEEIKKILSEFYNIIDSANKFYTLLFEIKSPDYPRSLKIEIRKEPKKIKVETNIAYSSHYNMQVMVKCVSLQDMMNAKILAFSNRKEIRDVYDIEFLYRKGITIKAEKAVLENLLKGIERLSKNDYSVKLGSLLEIEQRKYYKTKNFNLLKMHLKERLAQ
jgi:predicted nucleotidyltransferase component of viral defense system